MSLPTAFTPTIGSIHHSSRLPPKCVHKPTNPHPGTPSLKRPVLATDLDGTLLTTSKNIHPRNTAAVLAALSAGLVFLPATGKSPSGAFRAMGSLGAVLLQRGFRQGVFLNGLLVRNNTGVIHETFLCGKGVQQLVKFTREMGLVVLFYHRDSVFVERRNRFTDMFIASHEPVPTEIGSFDALGTVNKALVLDPRGHVKAYRAELERVLSGFAVVTQARDDVLEVMPEGVSKATGLELLLTELGFANDHVVAVGDNENDIDMIRMAGLGIAVGNAVPRLVNVADEIVCACDEGAIAEVLTRFVI